MKRTDFHFELPPERIARYPLSERSHSRLLMLGDEGMVHRRFTDLPALLRPGDLLVFNDTRVMPARLQGRKSSGGAVEILVERLLSENRALAHLRVSRAPRAGARLWLCDGAGEPVEATLRVAGREGSLFELVSDESFRALMARWGEMPLPPYLERGEEAGDRERYQTVYAEVDGAVAAPTAGLHFDRALLQAVMAQGVASTRITLHVGAGTFQPVRVDDLDAHEMHREWLSVTQDTCDAVARCRERGGRVIAVGTTAVRALETAAAGGELRPFCGDTRLFIRPGYRFRVVDAMITNFHLPESTLLMLVCAFGGYQRVMAAYREAVAREYRFFSYGDAMLVMPNDGASHAP